jgi:hypothetical protein
MLRYSYEQGGRFAPAPLSLKHDQEEHALELDPTGGYRFFEKIMPY